MIAYKYGDESQQQIDENCVAWTGRDHHEPGQGVDENAQLSESPERRYDEREIRYYNGQQNNINETQDRNSIASKSGFINMNDMTGITRGGEVTVNHDNDQYPMYQGASAQRQHQAMA